MRTHLVRLTAEGAAALARWQEEQAQRRRTCANCGGSGWGLHEFYEDGYHGYAKVQCPRCKGTGIVEVA